MRKSKSEAAATREKIVATASRVLLEKGLTSVGMRDLMQAADLTAGGFYRHFTSRDQLIAEAIRAAFDRLLAMLEAEIADKAPANQLERIVVLYLGQSRHAPSGTAPYLCPLAQLGAEINHSTPIIQAAEFDGYERLSRLIASCLQAISSLAAESRAEIIVNILVGAVTLAGLAPDDKEASRILHQAKLSLTGSASAPLSKSVKLNA